MNAEQQYIELFQGSRSAIDNHSAPLLNARRDAAFADFRRLGFPTQKVERYKYTDVAAAFAPDYGLNINRIRIPVNPYEAFRCDVPNLSTSLYFLVNDQFHSETRPTAPLPEGVIVDSLAKVATERPELVARYYGALASTAGDAICALNTMLAQDGLLVYIPQGIVVERPIQVVNILRADVPLMVNRRILIILEDGAQAKLLLCDHAVDNHPFLATQVTEVFVGKQARLQLYELEETHTENNRFAHTVVRQQARSQTTLDNITLHNGLTRNTTDVLLSGEGCATNVFGCVIADKRQHIDNNTLIDHQVSDCQSNELYKYVLDDEAVGAFAGRILVREGAQHTVSHETNANLCSTDTARMFTQPMLEIYADDVQCSHGSTVGQLNDAALFYMRQRGVPEEEARMLLKFAFASEVLDTIPMEALRDRLHYLVDKRFRGELSKCEGCKLCK
ncbi:MAG: Fe-S cluster assembly protein SufD [Bacteroidaceae bacterium]|nr:Fe-S cluster assembly protein SufD [Bacteroidaceae bacterium]